MERVILHSDCNCFYASVECLYHPELRDNPVAVGGDVEHRHGIILTKNYLAKGYGVKTGEALWQAKQKCPNLVILPPNYSRYLRFSQMAREIYLDYTDQVEPFGLDECWLDVTGSSRKGDGMAIAQEISQRIKSELGITVSIGVSYNKIFAKLGSDYKKPDAITRIGRDNFKEIAWPLDAGNLLYVGRATQRKLIAYGVHTIGDIANTPEYLLKSWFGKWGSVLYCFANGHDISPVAKYNDTVSIKSIGNSITAPRDLICDEDARIILYMLSDSVARRLRQQGMKGRVIGISVRNNGLCSFTRQHKLQNYTNITKEIAQAGLELFRQNYYWQQPVRSLGINISDLTGDSVSTQTDLFTDETQRERKEHLDKATDWLKRRFGTHVVQPAVLLKDQQLLDLDPIHDNTIHPVGYF